MKNKNELTPKQLVVFCEIKKFMAEKHFSPSIRELCVLCNINSPSVVLTHLRKIREKGYIDYVDKKMRTIRILGE